MMAMMFKNNMRLLFVAIIGVLLTPAFIIAENINLPKSANGWTVFTPSTDSRILYVSASGDDRTARFYNLRDSEIGNDPFNPDGAIRAYASYAAAYAATRNGYPDWILFKRGEEFVDTIGSRIRSGRGASEPFLVGSYGASGLSPIVKTGINQALRVNDTTRYFAISGIDFYANTRDPRGADYRGNAGGTGFTLLTGSGQNISGVLFEGCKFRFYNGNDIQIYAGTFIGDIIIRRCLIADNYSETHHSQGLYANRVDGIVLEENIFIHNGWYIQSRNGDNNPAGGQATMFNHNIYFSGTRNVSLKENLFIEPSQSHNKFTNPYSADYVDNINITNNLYLGGEVGISMGHNYQSTPWRVNNVNITDNVMSNLGMSNPTRHGISWGYYISGLDVANITGNLLINQKETSGINNVEGFYIENDIRHTVISNNVIYNTINGRGLRIRPEASGSSNISFRNNKIQIPTASGYTIMADHATSNIWNCSGNSYFSDKADGRRVRYNGREMSFSTWFSSSGDSSFFERYAFADTTRDVDTYQQYLGGAASVDSFISACRSQDRYRWNDNYAADRVNSWIRDGFSSETSENSSPPSEEDEVLSPPLNLRIVE